MHIARLLGGCLCQGSYGGSKLPGLYQQIPQNGVDAVVCRGKSGCRAADCNGCRALVQGCHNIAQVLQGVQAVGVAQTCGRQNSGGFIHVSLTTQAEGMQDKSLFVLLRHKGGKQGARGGELTCLNSLHGMAQGAQVQPV